MTSATLFQPFSAPFYHAAANRVSMQPFQTIAKIASLIALDSIYNLGIFLKNSLTFTAHIVVAFVKTAYNLCFLTEKISRIAKNLENTEEQNRSNKEIEQNREDVANKCRTIQKEVALQTSDLDALKKRVGKSCQANEKLLRKIGQAELKTASTQTKLDKVTEDLRESLNLSPAPLDTSAFVPLNPKPTDSIEEKVKSLRQLFSLTCIKVEDVKKSIEAPSNSHTKKRQCDLRTNTKKLNGELTKVIEPEKDTVRTKTEKEELNPVTNALGFLVVRVPKAIYRVFQFIFCIPQAIYRREHTVPDSITVGHTQSGGAPNQYPKLELLPREESNKTTRVMLEEVEEEEEAELEIIPTPTPNKKKKNTRKKS